MTNGVPTAAHRVLDVSEVVVGHGSADRSAIDQKIPARRSIVDRAIWKAKPPMSALIKLKSQIGEAYWIGIAGELASGERPLVAPGAKMVVSVGAPWWK